MLIRRLSQSGLARFSAFLDALSTEQPEYPHDLLEHPDDSVPLVAKIPIENRSFETRFELATYLYKAFSDARVTGVENDTGLWAWLSLLWFEHLCRRDEAGKYLPGELARWIPENDNFRKYYRHLLRGPYCIYSAHVDTPKRAMAVLCGVVQEPGDVVEQLSARQELVTNAAVMGAATLLYFDPTSSKLRRGAAGRGPGSARRLADLLNQFDVTWDLYGMSDESLLGILPSEFDRFLAPPHR